MPETLVSFYSDKEFGGKVEILGNMLQYYLYSEFEGVF